MLHAGALKIIRRGYIRHGLLIVDALDYCKRLDAERGAAMAMV